MYAIGVTRLSHSERKIVYDPFDTGHLALETIRDNIQTKEDELATLRAQRNELVIDAINNHVKYSAVSRWAGISRAAIVKIMNGKIG